MDLIKLDKAPTVVSLPNPVTAEHKEVSIAAFLPGETLGSYIERTGIRVAKGPVHVWQNGRTVPPELWTRLIPRNGDSIVIRARMHGGGGGSKILRTVAMVALIVATAGVGSMLAAAGWSTMAVAGASAAMMIGGSLLINALLPPPSPTIPKLGGGQKYDSSPTYSIQGGRNRMRPWEPMTVIFGRHKVVPDLGANYFTEYVGDDQYLNQLFHFGLQADSVVLSDFRIGNTPIGSYQDVEIEVSGHDGKLSLFAGNVDTIQGFVVNNVGGWVQRTTPADTTHISVELAAQVFRINDSGNMASRTVELRLQYRRIGASAWTDIGMLSDAIYATHYWALMEEYSALWGGDAGHVTTERRQIRYGSTNRSEHTDDELVVLSPAYCTGGGDRGETCYPAKNAYWTWTRHPHATGKPWRGKAPDPLIGYSTSPGIRISGARQEPTRRTVGINVPKGQYEVRVRKVSADIKTSRESNEMAVGQILCFQPDEADYSGQLRVALRIKATGQLNGAVDEFSAIAHASAPLWGGVEFNVAQTGNPAAWFLHFAQGKRLGDGTRVYGGGLADEQIDFDSIKAWSAWCVEKRLTFNYVLDRKMSTAEVLQMIARAGRASPTWQSGKLGVIWDAADQLAVAMFGPFNIKAGSFKVDYLNEGTVDEIIVNFTNEKTWEMDEVRVKVPGTTITTSPLQLDFDGCTNDVMAGKEANLLAASQVWHRRRISWETDIEGWVANRGDVVQFSHDLTVWGYSGRLVGRDENLITLDKHIPSAGAGTLMVRGPEGQMKIVGTASEFGEVDVLTITADMSDFPLPGDDGYEGVVPMDWAWFFDPLATPGRRFKITHVEPSGSDGVKFQAVDDDPGYYASENSPYVYVPLRDGVLLGGAVLGITTSESILDMYARTFNIELQWVLSVSTPVNVVVSVNGKPQPAVRTEDRSITAVGKKGDVIGISITPDSALGKGEPKTFSYTVEGVIPAPIAPASMSLDVVGAQLQLAWPKSPDVWVDRYEVRDRDSGWGGAGHLFRGDALSCLVKPGEPGIPKTWYVRAINAADLYSDSSASASYTVALPDDPTSASSVFADTSLTNATITLDWPGVEPIFGLSFYRVSYGDEVKTVKATTITLPADWIGNRKFTIQTVDLLGNASPGLAVDIEKLLPNPPLDVRAQVIDNNVLLYWDLPEKTTLPVSHIMLKEGEAWSTAREIGTKSGSFTSFSELQGGGYTYWLATVDTDDHQSVPVKVTVNVNEPPDFIFRGEQYSELDGVLTSARLERGAVLLPVNTTETWQEHFTGRGWDGPQDQVDDGYPVYIQPTATSGSYVEVFDFGNLVASSRATVSFGGESVAGLPILRPQIDLSDDGLGWIEYPGATDVFGTNFRYVRFTLAVEQSGDDALYRLETLSCRLATKLKNDGGHTVCDASDPLGTVANFGATFLDVSSIVVTAAGTVPATAVYDFKDTVQAGTYSVSGEVATITAAGHGFIAGQDVQLNITSGAAQPQRARILSALENSFTAQVDSPDTSGNVLVYAQSMRIYLFNQSGQRVSGTASWAIKGNG